MTPEGWTLSRLGDVTDVAIGGTPSRSAPELWDPERHDGYRWVAISDLKGRVIAETAEYISALGVQRSNVKRVPAGTPIMSFKLSIGRTALAGCELYTNEAIAAFHRRGPVEPGYLLYALPRAAEEHGEVDVAVKGKTLNKAKLIDLPLLLPPLPEQRKIAAILSSVDDAIEATQAVIDQLQVVKKAMMAELLTRGLPGRHTRFKMTEIGEIPEEWEVRRIGDLIETSAYGTSAKSEAGGSGFPVLRIPNVVTESITIEDLKYASLKASEVEAYALRPGDLLVIRTNGNPLYVGRAAVVPQLAGTWLYASYLIRLRVNHAVITPEFLHEAMRSEAVRKTMQGAIRTSAGNYNLNTQGIVNTIVPVPSLTEQAKLTSLTKTIEGRCSAELTYLAELRTVKSALMSVLLTGEVRVKPDEGAPA